jgi:hypothetical protein
MDTPTVQTPPPPVAQPVPAPPPPPKNNSGVLIGIFLVLLGILAGVAFTKTTILSGLRIPYLSATPTPTLLATPTPTPDPTAGWKTYTNSIYGYEFKYPANFAISEQSSLGQEVSDKWHFVKVEDCINLKKDECEVHPTNVFQVETHLNPTINKIEQISLDSCYLRDPRSTVKKIQLSGIDFLVEEYPVDEQSVQGSCKGHITEATYAYNKVLTSFYKQKEIIIFLFSFSQTKTNTVLDKILSTFKFLDQTTIPSTTTYTCPPSGWVDCMPGTTAKPECSLAAMTWYKANCPDFKGGAL